MFLEKSISKSRKTVEKWSNYTAFGSPMPGRKYVGSNYAYNFNGKRSDAEANSTAGGMLDYGLRIYNPALGKFLSRDPLAYKFSYYSPYHFAGNSPIANLDLDGAEDISYLYVQNKNGKGYALFKKTDYRGTTQTCGDRGHGVEVILINSKGEVCYTFISTDKYSTETPTLSHIISDFLKGPGGKADAFVGKHMEKKHAPFKKGEVGIKGSVKIPFVKGQIKGYISDDEGDEVKISGKGQLSTKIDKKLEYEAPSLQIYMKFTLNNEAGLIEDLNPKLNVQIPIIGNLGTTISVNSKGVSSVEINLGISKKASANLESDGNGNISEGKVSK